jgi:hypothetical protein
MDVVENERIENNRTKCNSKMDFRTVKLAKTDEDLYDIRAGWIAFLLLIIAVICMLAIKFWAEWLRLFRG